uniref:(California timema) hypothetical protein n=1 Tax=Timema californicum TaxID=61474 RepID=A0A7R9IZM9_TIMCA|nr:unnamed protein product [Timema californicum]
MRDLVPIMKSDIDNVPIKYDTNIHTYGKDQAHLHDYTLKKGHVEKSLDVNSDSPWIDVMECSSLSMMANESNVGNLQDSLLPPKVAPFAGCLVFLHLIAPLGNGLIKNHLFMTHSKVRGKRGGKKTGETYADILKQDPSSSDKEPSPTQTPTYPIDPDIRIGNIQLWWPHGLRRHSHIRLVCRRLGDRGSIMISCSSNHVAKWVSVRIFTKDADATLTHPLSPRMERERETDRQKFVFKYPFHILYCKYRYPSDTFYLPLRMGVFARCSVQATVVYTLAQNEYQLRYTAGCMYSHDAE